MEGEKLLGGGRNSFESVLDSDVEIQTNSARSHRSRISIWLKRLTITWLLLWSLASVSTRVWNALYHAKLPGRVSCACGNSIPEAMSMGCKFDSLASAWLQPACIDEELTYEFDHAGPGPNGEWYYYTDSDGTDTYTLEEVANLAETGISYWNTQSWHLAHCTFNWRKTLRTQFTGVQVEARSDTEAHVKHCEAVFKSIGYLDWIGTESVITLDADWAGMHHEEHMRKFDTFPKLKSLNFPATERLLFIMVI